MKPRSTGQLLALVLVSSVGGALLAAFVFDRLAERREAAQSAPLPAPLAPGHGSA